MTMILLHGERVLLDSMERRRVAQEMFRTRGISTTAPEIWATFPHNVGSLPLIFQDDRLSDISVMFIGISGVAETQCSHRHADYEEEYHDNSCHHWKSLDRFVEFICAVLKELS